MVNENILGSMENVSSRF